VYRLFVPPETLASQPVVLGRELAHRLGRVLGLRLGDRVVLLDNTGWEYEGEIARLARDLVEVRLVGKSLARGEPATCIHLYQALLKATKIEWVLQKGTELGVSSFTPLVCRRSVPGTPAVDTMARWGKIIQQAAEQSGRGLLPALNPPLALAEAVAVAPGLRLLPWEGERARGLRAVLEAAMVASRGGHPNTQPVARSLKPEARSPQPEARSPWPEISLFIGPEGGWEEEEVALASSRGAVAVSLGARILRAETAGLAAAAAILYQAGELGGW